jgi:hypothetical protein
MLAAAAFVVAAAALVLAALWALQRRLIYLPFPADVPPAATLLAAAREVTLRTLRTDDNLELGAWFVPPTDPEQGAAVLVAGGNAGNRFAPGAARGRSRPRGARRPALRLPRLRHQPRATHATRPRPRRPRRPALPDRRGRRAARSDSPLRREPGIGGRDRAGDRAPARGARAPLAVSRPRHGRARPLPVPAGAAAAAGSLPARRAAGARRRPDDDRLRRRRRNRPGAAEPRRRRLCGRPARLVQIEYADHNDRALLDGPELIAAVVACLPSRACGG